METGDGVVRRKLNFNEKTFALKSFYVDIRSASIRNKVLKYIHDLGGHVETFLSKDIHVFVTDTKHNKRLDRVRDLNQSVLDGSSLPESPSQQSPSLGGSCLPLSRGKALLLKARGNGSENNSSGIDRGLSSNVMIQKASGLGLKIEHVNVFLKKCKTLAGSLKTHKSKSDTLGDIVPLKWDSDALIVKVEDACNLYRPLHKQFDKLPIVYADNGGGSPFDGPVVLAKPENVRSVKQPKSTKFYTAKGGYCEMCDYYFKASLREHLLSERHKSFVEEEANFSGVEHIVNKLPNLSNFLAKFCIPKPVYEENFDDRVGLCDDVIKHNDTCDNKPVVSEDIDKNNNDILVTTNLEIEHKTIPEHNEITNGESPMEDHDFTSSDTIIYDYDEQLKGDNSTLQTQTTTNVQPTPNVQNGSINVVPPSNSTVMFSEDSGQDSQTDVLKNMINNWTLDGSEAKNNFNFDAMSCNTPNQESRPSSVTALLPGPGRVVPGLPKPVGVAPIYSDSEPDIGMSFSTPKAEERSLLGDIMSNLKHLKEPIILEKKEPEPQQERAKSRKRKHENVEEGCMYVTKKTDDTKLKIKLCKMTPKRKNTNLKMFWKVRKTGDCRLVFSAGKSKKPLHDTNNDENIISASPSRKRQRVLEF